MVTGLERGLPTVSRSSDRRRRPSRTGDPGARARQGDSVAIKRPCASRPSRIETDASATTSWPRRYERLGRSGPSREVDARDVEPSETSATAWAGTW